METIEFEISLAVNDPSDILNQREILSIYDTLKPHGATIVPFQVEVSSETGIAKSAELDTLIGSVHIILPASAFVTILTSFIRHYFEARRKRSIRIKRKDGTSIQIDGYSEHETQKLINQLTEYKKED